MITDKIENAHIYIGLNKRIEIALNYIQNTNFTNIELGKHEIDGDNIFAIVSEYETKNAEDCLLEGHKKYIDLQYIIEGSEQIGFASYSNQLPIEKYNNTDDYWLFKCNYSLMTLHKGFFAILFPDDLHIPGLKVKDPSKVKKLVVKIKI